MNIIIIIIIYFLKQKNDFINDFTTLYKHYKLIPALQLYIKRSYSTLCILDNRNIQIRISDR